MNQFRGFVECLIGGKTRPVKFDFNTLADLSERHGLSFRDLKFLDSKRMTASQLRTMVYSGLMHGARAAGKDADFTIEDVGSWIGELMRENPKGLEELFRSYYRALSGPEGNAAAEQTEKKRPPRVRK